MDSKKNYTIENAIGFDIKDYIDDIANLRIKVFREFPYLYDGSIEYEMEYLDNYSNCSDSLAVIARDGDKIIGVSTALPLSNADIEFQKPFLQKNYDVSLIFYFAESVLLPEYRGMGIGNRFFESRELFAKTLGYNIFAFCAIEREHNHELKPENYYDMQGWWKKLGYEYRPDLACKFKWKQINSEQEVENTLSFWKKSL